VPKSATDDRWTSRWPRNSYSFTLGLGHSLGRKLNAAEAGPLLCEGVAVFAPHLMYASPADRGGTIGIGGLGHMAVKFAAAYGCDVTAFTSSTGESSDARGFGVHHVVLSHDVATIEKLAGSVDLLISTIKARLDWDAMIGALAPNVRLHLAGAVLEPLTVDAFSLIVQQHCASGSLGGSPATIATMFDFASLHNITPQTEHFPMSYLNQVVARPESGKARYCIVTEAHF
jgi:uncharacterized zinc-type alcohol dehydrogenase-like protein